MNAPECLDPARVDVRNHRLVWGLYVDEGLIATIDPVTGHNTPAGASTNQDVLSVFHGLLAEGLRRGLSIPSFKGHEADCARFVSAFFHATVAAGPKSSLLAFDSALGEFGTIELKTFFCGGKHWAWSQAPGSSYRVLQLTPIDRPIHKGTLKRVPELAWFREQPHGAYVLPVNTNDPDQLLLRSIFGFPVSWKDFRAHARQESQDAIMEAGKRLGRLV